MKPLLALTLLGFLTACGSNADVDKGGHGGSGADNGAGGGNNGADGSGIGASSGSSGAGGQPILGGNAGGPGNTRDGSTTCAAQKGDVKPVTLDIALLVDTSYSMDFDLRWQYLKGALEAFVSNPGQGDLGLALQFFPLRDQCSIDAYGTPTFPMAPVSGSVVDIESTLEARRMSGGTPLVQILQGMGTYTKKWATDHPDHKTVIVVATDGVPDDTCAAMSLTPPNSLANAATIAKGLATGTPALPIFVIGVGEELDALNTIADAGGTGSAVLISNGNNAQQQILDALRTIRQKSLGCDYLVPDNTNGAIDFQTVNVNFTEGHATDSFYYVGDQTHCDLSPDKSWYYDNAQHPTKVVLCPAACTRVAAAIDARIDIAYGCKQLLLQ